MRQRQPQELRVAELDAEAAREIRDGARLLLIERLDRPARGAQGKEALEPFPPAQSRRGLRQPGSAPPSAAASATGAGAYVRAFRARVTLCPPNPNEFETAARTVRFRA